MKRWIVTPWVFVGSILLLVAVEPACAVDNLRVAYPSMNTSVFALVIAQKEGYFKEEGLNVELLSIRGEIAIRRAWPANHRACVRKGGEKVLRDKAEGGAGEACARLDRRRVRRGWPR